DPSNPPCLPGSIRATSCLFRLRGLPTKMTTPIFAGGFSGKVYVEPVDFLNASVPQEERASIGGHSEVGPDATGIFAAKVLKICNAFYLVIFDVHSGVCQWRPIVHIKHVFTIGGPFWPANT